MNYSLGNMLSRGGALNPDGLSLDLAFALDKTLTARKGPTPTFTRASTATFVGSDGLIQSAAINTPRFDHDPVTLACKGLLIEEARTNSFKYSEIFNASASSNYWASISANAVTSNQTTSPDGATTADLLTTSATAFDCFVRTTANWVGSTQYSYSIFLKRGPSNHRYVGLYIGAGITGATQYPYFDFDNPTAVQIPSGTMVGTINSTRVDAYPNGWYRVCVTFTTASTPVTVYGGVYISISNGALPNSSAAGLDAYIWGIQAELGSFPTSYIPTTTAALTRSADVCSITGSDFAGMWQSATAATILLEADASAMTASTSGNRGIATLSNGAAYSNQIGFYKESGTNFIRGRTPTVNLIQVSNLLGKFKGAIAIDSSTAGCFNGGTVITGSDNIGTVDRLTFADATLSPAGHPSVCISRYQIYRKRLPDAKLQSLTTL